MEIYCGSQLYKIKIIPEEIEEIYAFFAIILPSQKYIFWALIHSILSKNNDNCVPLCFTINENN